MLVGHVRERVAAGETCTYESMSAAAWLPPFGRLPVSRPVVILVLVSVVALVAGFLAFGGANMGQ
jgi:hypothetical protein